jgi:hypothetical protein
MKHTGKNTRALASTILGTLSDITTNVVAAS